VASTGVARMDGTISARNRVEGVEFSLSLAHAGHLYPTMKMGDCRDLKMVRPPSIAALLFGLIPFTAMCFTVPLWDRIDPMILGLPFNLFWLILWIILTPGCLWAAYRVEAARGAALGRPP